MYKATSPTAELVLLILFCFQIKKILNFAIFLSKNALSEIAYYLDELALPPVIDAEVRIIRLFTDGEVNSVFRILFSLYLFNVYACKECKLYLFSTRRRTLTSKN